MEVVGSEIGQKMRSAIKAKLTELGCYVDDELPDYVMVMVANKRTRSQMEEDLQLFLGDNTVLFVNWLHQVLKKLQEVTVPPLKAAEAEKVREKSKEKKVKTKKVKDKTKKTDSKKAKKKEKEKSRRKEERKAHKSKKKSKKHEMIRPNIPPLLMNIEKESEPSITDVFAGQILKNHGITLDVPVLSAQKDLAIETKPIIKEKRPILPIIDPATIQSQPEVPSMPKESQTQTNTINIDQVIEPDDNVPSKVVEPQDNIPSKTVELQDNVPSTQIIPEEAPRQEEEQMKQIDEIEAKIEGLKQKLAEQLESMSEDEDFLNIRTEAEELMNDFAEDVFREISSQAPTNTLEPTPPPKSLDIPVEKPKDIPAVKETPVDAPKELPETIELKLPKRPVRERLGTREEAVKLLEMTKLPEKKTSPERYPLEPEPDFWAKSKPSARARLGSQPERKRGSFSSDSEGSETERRRKRIASSSSERSRGERTGRAKCASVVVVKPRMRPQTSTLLLRAVADANKSLLNIPPQKIEVEPRTVKRALVLPMRRTIDNQKIVVQVPRERDRHTAAKGDDKNHDKNTASEADRPVEYVPTPLSRRFTNSEYVPSRREPPATLETPIDNINIHNPTVGKEKDTQFIVTMDGFNPNAFLAKKLMKEGLLNNENELKSKPKTSSVMNTKPAEKTSDEKLDKDKEIVQKDGNVPLDKKSNADKSDESVTKKSEINESDATKKLTADEEIPKEKSQNKTQIEKESSSNQIDDEKEIEHNEEAESSSSSQNLRLSETSEDSDTQVIIKLEKVDTESVEKRKNDNERHESPPVKKRKASPIVFDMGKKERERKKDREKEREIEEKNKAEERDKTRKRERTESASSDGHVIVTTAVANKYDTVPPLSSADRKPVWCRSFPSCRYGAACAFQHPRCKFAAACTRRGCPYSHEIHKPSPTPVVASHVVPAANYKTITPGVLPSICRFYPNCSSPACRFYHPKPCRFGPACVNKLECNFYHSV